ncbi:hypothetical protein [Candidatus Uabimicrobium sp. HlEnr_7]|uniref:hypothetical protein n=1 Tax=Candidatus Uabimicrobium helgolandensis TaxID=3095367 RepID=UPI0035560FF6
MDLLILILLVFIWMWIKLEKEVYKKVLVFLAKVGIFYCCCYGLAELLLYLSHSYFTNFPPHLFSYYHLISVLFCLCFIFALREFKSEWNTKNKLILYAVILGVLGSLYLQISKARDLWMPYYKTKVRYSNKSHFAYIYPPTIYLVPGYAVVKIYVRLSAFKWKIFYIRKHTRLCGSLRSVETIGSTITLRWEKSRLRRDARIYTEHYTLTKDGPKKIQLNNKK